MEDTYRIVVEDLTGLVRQIVKENIFHWVRIGREQVKVDILQFGDDIFVGGASHQNILTVKAILRCFELVSGLRVNFHKSSIRAFGIYRVRLHNFLNI